MATILKNGRNAYFCNGNMCNPIQMSPQNEIIPLMEGYGGGGALWATKACGLPVYVFLIFTLECIGRSHTKLPINMLCTSLQNDNRPILCPKGSP